MTDEMRKVIIKMAKAYIATKKATFVSVAKKFAISPTTVGKYLNIYLKEIDISLWEKVQEKKAINIARSQKNVIPTLKRFIKCTRASKKK